MNIVNDNSCSWLNDLNERSNIKNLDKDKFCDWLIVGVGYTGLFAARKLSKIIFFFSLEEKLSYTDK